MMGGRHNDKRAEDRMRLLKRHNDIMNRRWNDKRNRRGDGKRLKSKGVSHTFFLVKFLAKILTK
jgi:hypothetical protein